MFTIFSFNGKTIIQCILACFKFVSRVDDFCFSSLLCQRYELFCIHRLQDDLNFTDVIVILSVFAMFVFHDVWFQWEDEIFYASWHVSIIVSGGRFLVLARGFARSANHCVYFVCKMI